MRGREKPQRKAGGDEKLFGMAGRAARGVSEIKLSPTGNLLERVVSEGCHDDRFIGR